MTIASQIIACYFHEHAEGVVNRLILGAIKYFRGRSRERRILPHPRLMPRVFTGNSRLSQSLPIRTDRHPVGKPDEKSESQIEAFAHTPNPVVVNSGSSAALHENKSESTMKVKNSRHNEGTGSESPVQRDTGEQFADGKTFSRKRKLAETEGD